MAPTRCPRATGASPPASRASPPGGTFTVVVDGLNLPTSVEFIGDTAYVVTLSGELLKIDNVSGR